MLNTCISASGFNFLTLVELMRWRANQQPEQSVYTFLTDGDRQEYTYTCAELDRRARIIGASLQEQIPQGERALLIYPSGLDFIAAFLVVYMQGL